MKELLQSAPTRALLRATSVAALICAGGAAMAQAAPFTELGDFEGRMGATSAAEGPIVPGGSALLMGRGLEPGGEVSLRQSGVVLNDGAPVVADDQGAFRLEIQIPDNAQPGAYPVVAEFTDPPYATTFDVRVSPDLGDVGVEDYTVESHDVIPGLYQVVESPELGAVYVTSANGRPPVAESDLVKLDAETLEVVATARPEAAPRGGVYAVYGVGVDAERGQVWVTNTRQNTVAVYDAEDLSLLKQFPEGLVSHGRDVVLFDGKAYASATFTPNVEVFDADSLEHAGTIELASGRRGQSFGTASLALDEGTGTLVVAGLATSEVAMVDLASGEQTDVFQVPGAERVIGVAYDAEHGRIYTANAGTDNVSILDAASGDLIRNVPVGSSPLNVSVAPDHKVYVAVRGSDTVVVLDGEGEVLANLEVGSLPNDVYVASNGDVLAVNKRRGAEDPEGDKITRITPKE